MLDSSQTKKKGLSWANKDLSKQEFQDCIFEQSDFSYADLSYSSLQNVTFISCNLSGINLTNSRLLGVTFNGCKLTGVDFHQCASTLGSPRFSFSQCVVNGCNFSDLKLSKTPFLNSQLENCVFNNTDLTEADFSMTHLSNTLFHSCKLQKSNFITSRNYIVDPTSNTITKAKFSLPEAISLLKFLDIELQ
ncbi:MAG: pentapeptide repeat-containing protein [Candidatus Abawacabacteria bacterium]|nr:pentapeptide repeat-containing protein [Candidatus Abawacabacteria bacterium]